MAEMSAVELSAKGIDVFREGRRVLLTVYADRDAAIQAINHARIHHYLLKRWDPPEQNFYPVLDDLLSDWQASHKPVFEGVKVLGHRWSPRSYGVRDFLARNQVAYRFFDVETADRNPEIQKMVDENGGATAKLPIAIFADGTALSEPTIPDIAMRLGLRTRADMSFYDLLIVGGGPAGTGAAGCGGGGGFRRRRD